jgi:large subunit ribosomal protein L23
VSVGRVQNPRDILLRPVISEKSYRLADDGKYTFLVDLDANKTQIRQAVDTKRAIVSLAEGDRIDLFGPVS